MQAKAFKKELELRKEIGKYSSSTIHHRSITNQYESNLGVIPTQTEVVAVPDPGSVRVGSGGATLNALLVVSQHLCAKVFFF